MVTTILIFSAPRRKRIEHGEGIMMSLHDDCLAIYRQEGSNDFVGVKKLLEERYPDPERLVEALFELEGTGFWHIHWHVSSRAPSPRHEYGVVDGYLG